MSVAQIQTSVEASKDFQAPPPEQPRPLRRMVEASAPYPVEALGGVLSSAVYAICERVQAPLAICAQSVLATATLAVQAQANVMMPFGQVRPLCNFFVTVAETGDRKSSADKDALMPVEKFEKKLRSKFEVDYTLWKNSYDAWKKQRDKILGDKKRSKEETEALLNGLGEAPVGPLQPMLTCPEPSFEGLCKFLAVGQPSVGVFSGEGGQFIGGYGMSQENRLKTSAGLCTLWDGDILKRVRAGDGTLILPGRRASLHLMAQPQVADQLLSDPLLADQGLLSRILVSAPDTISGTRFYKTASEQSNMDLIRYEEHILSILDGSMPLAEGKNNELEPRDLPLSQKATAAWVEFVNQVEGNIAPDAPLVPIKGFANKMPELSARIAGVLSLIKDLSCAEISSEHMEAGIMLIRYYADEALRLKCASNLNPDIAAAEKLLHWLQVKWTEPLIALSVIYQFGPSKFHTAADARKAVSVLEDHGWLVPLESGAVVKEQYRREVWRIVKE